MAYSSLCQWVFSSTWQAIINQLIISHILNPFSKSETLCIVDFIILAKAIISKFLIYLIVT